jgi:hypothetical protein
MFKLLSAALVAASVLVAPLVASAAQPAHKVPAATHVLTFKHHHKRHVVKHRRVKHAMHARFIRKHVRHGRFIGGHRHVAKVVKTPRARMN